MHSASMANCKDLRELNAFLFDRNSGQASKRATAILGNENFLPRDKYNTIFNNDYGYSFKICCGGDGTSFVYETHNKHKYHRHYYSQKKKKWQDGDIKLTYFFMGNRWYEMHRKVNDSRVLDDYWNSYSTDQVDSHVRSSDGLNTYDNIHTQTTRNHQQGYNKNKYLRVHAKRFFDDFAKLNNDGEVIYGNGYFTILDLKSR